MKITSIRMYQPVKLSGSLSLITFVSKHDAKTGHIEMEYMEGLGVKITHSYNHSMREKLKESLIIPFTNIGSFTVEDEVKAESKSKK